ncbi:MmcQ/YjbR family DNA-binding protein [Isoptericola sp. NPDC056618]|uniref:MmcQ/YjbR family DNA-binding protein n=1 Tax=Isoptericola sp. NPDC056618 TaxID=3345878 RepID=UPI00368309E1
MGPTQHQDVAAATALALPGVTRTWPFGPEHDVFKVRAKVFCMTTEVMGTPLVTLKCAPDDGEALRQELETVTAGYHMNKRHWISLAAGPGITPDLVEELVLEAYALVVAALPRRLRPIDLDDTERFRTGLSELIDGRPPAGG